MKAAVIFAIILILAYLQVTAAPYFLFMGAQVDLLLVSLALLLTYQGPRTAMITLPVIALVLGFVSDRSPAMLIVAFTPLLPLAYWMDNAATPLSRYMQTVLAVGATSAWARCVLAIGPWIDGANVSPGVLVFQVVLPGVILDLALLSLAYLASWLLRWQPRSLSPARERYRA